MLLDKLNEHSHRRLNILTGEWVQVSPHRAKRPWQGGTERSSIQESVSYDPGCYLCPGNARSSGEVNEDYTSTYSFTNDFSAITDSIPDILLNENELLVAHSEKGICKVICFSPDHRLTIAEMSCSAVTKIIIEWIEQYKILGSISYINHVQIFENKGAIMGCSNPHPHGQVWAQQSIPVEVAKKQVRQSEYYQKTGRTIVGDYVNLEMKKGIRVVEENEHFVAVVPFWATWPFEVMITPKRAMRDISCMNVIEVEAFARIYRNVAIRYDNLFETSFPYSAGIHQAPTDDNRHNEWHWHMSFYPPLLRSATIKKFMVGYEMFGNPQRDITPEFSAHKLREMSTIHFADIQTSLAKSGL